MPVRISGMMLAALIGDHRILLPASGLFVALLLGRCGQDHHSSGQFSGGYDDRLHGAPLFLYLF
ncbi:hypothetical protein [Methanothrix sp.]|uniref:hypothetical protein n=2 Tax=Methanothrix sp. TaxID=90426 RepID=UPI003BB4B016